MTFLRSRSSASALSAGIVDLVGIVADELVDREVVLLLEQLHLGLEPLVAAAARKRSKTLWAKSMLPSRIWSSRVLASFLNSSTSAFRK